MTAEPPDDLAIHYETRSTSGERVDDSAQRPMPVLVWDAPATWQPGDSVVVETTPWYLPRSFAPALRVESGGQTQRAKALSSTQAPALVTEVAADGSLRLPAMDRRNGLLELWEGPLYPVESVEASFAGEDWTVRLREWSAPLSVAPGGEFPVLFYWQAGRPAPKDYNIFVHLRDATDRTVAQDDGPPTWFVDRPTTRWTSDKDGLAGGTDAHTIVVPADAPPGRYEVVVGWYDWQTGKRLRLTPGTGLGGNGQGDEHVLGVITVDPSSGPRPDTVCLMAKEACASLE